MSNHEKNGSQYQQYERAQQANGHHSHSANTHDHQQQASKTANSNDTINVFEFEPNGYMSRGRW